MLSKFSDRKHVCKWVYDIKVKLDSNIIRICRNFVEIWNSLWNVLSRIILESILPRLNLKNKASSAVNRVRRFSALIMSRSFCFLLENFM